MDRIELVFALAIGTIAIALAWGLWQRFSVRRSQARSGVKPGPERGTEEMLQHRQSVPPSGNELRAADIQRGPRSAD
jgi:hypothetical protein